MEKNRGSKFFVIAALLIGVLGLSLGFAAYSRTLNISTGANIGLNEENFKVLFSTSGTDDDTTIATVLTNASVTNGAEAALTEDAAMSGTSISGLSANFTKPGQSVTYTLYVHNAGAIAAYLKSITYNSVEGSNTKVCTAGTGTSNNLVQSACTGISLSVKVGTENATTGSVSSISNHLLDIDDFETVTITIDYDKDAAATDGDFTVNFGTVELLYKSVDA